MSNTLTDTLKLVQKEEGRSTFAIFRRKRTEHYGFCLVVFRGKAFLGYIPSSDITVEGDIVRRYDRIGIKNGDTILSVNLGPQPLEISETLPTRDGYPCDYGLILDIRVIDPVKFAQQYVQETDPVARAKTAIEGHIQQCSGHYLHDDMNEGLLREFAEQSLTIEPNTAFGLTVVKAQKATLFMNPTRAREREIARNRAIEEQRIQSEGYLSRVQKQEDIDLQTLTTQGEIDVEQLKIEARRRQEELEAEIARQEEIKRQAHEQRKAISDREEQLRQQEHSQKLEWNTTQQQFFLEKERTGHDQQIEEMKLLDRIKHQVSIHEVDFRDAQHKLEMDRLAWESQMRQNLIAEVGKGAIPALTARIREQLTDDKSSLSRAVNDPELQYLLDILKGGSSATPNIPLLNGGEHKEDVSISESNTVPLSSAETQEPPSEVFPGVIQQKTTMIEIPDLGLKLIQAALSEEQCRIAGVAAESVGFIVCKVAGDDTNGNVQLQVSDIVIELNGVQPRTIQDISQSVHNLEPDSIVPLCILRGEALMEVEVRNPR